MHRAPRVVAIIAAYNESDIIGQVIASLIAEGVSVYVIDNGSSDGTLAEAERFLHRGLIGVESFPPATNLTSDATDQFPWEALLRRKAEIASELDAEWFIHHDADEFRESPWFDLSLSAAISRVDRAGFNAIDFAVLNFRPTTADRDHDDVRQRMRYYEEADEHDRRQIKCWKRTERTVDLASSGGHDVQFPDRRVFPIRFLLRHYPVRSQEHGDRKIFAERKNRFLPSELARGWHVQYDHIHEGAAFVRDPTTLREFDADAVRLNQQRFNRELEGLQSVNQALRRRLDEFEREFETLRKHLATQDAELERLRPVVSAQEAQLAELRPHLAKQDAELTYLRQLFGKRAVVDKRVAHSHVVELDSSSDDPRVLVYHRVGHAAVDNHRLCVSPPDLVQQLRILKAEYHLMSLSDLAKGMASSQIPARAAAITFDDGYVDSLTEASPLLREMGAPATFFITTGRLNQPFEYWWDGLERIVVAAKNLPERLSMDAGGVRIDAPVRSHDERLDAYRTLHRVMLHRSPDEREQVMDRLVAWSGQARIDARNRRLSMDEIAQLADLPGHEVGSHSRSHLFLPAQSDETVDDEIIGSKRDLESIVSRPVNAFAYPFGGIDARATAVAARAGYRIAVTCEARPARLGDSLLALPRLDCGAARGAEEFRRLLRG